MMINNVSLKAIKRQLDHEGMEYIYSANIYLGTKKVGIYQEDYMCGDPTIEVDDKYEEELKDIAKKFFNKYPKGFLNGKYSFSVKDLYANDLINGLCTELGEMDFYEKQAKKAFKKGYNYYVVSSEKGKNREQCWFIMSKQALEHHKKEHDIYFIAEKDKNSFDFVV